MNSFNKYIINKKAIRNNLMEYIKKDHDSKICIVLKANGYGIGTKNVVDAIDDLAYCYAVANFKEAECVRDLTYKKILVLNFVPEACLSRCAEKGIVISISCVDQIKSIVKTKYEGTLLIHFAINTGMNRIGFSDMDEFIKACVLVRKNKNRILIDGIYTHFSSSEDVQKTRNQFELYKKYIKTLKLFFNTNKIIKHCSASVASNYYPEYRMDMVRLGICLYDNSNKKNLNLDLKSVITIKSKIINITSIKPGESVGYGNNFLAKRNMRIATIPLGYADGIFRSYSKKGYVIIKNRPCRIIGPICMDMFMVDVSKIDAKLFDEVLILDGRRITFNDIAKRINTISYEVLTSIKTERFDVIIK